jgi:hypothetical protein
VPKVPFPPAAVAQSSRREWLLLFQREIFDRTVLSLKDAGVPSFFDKVKTSVGATQLRSRLNLVEAEQMRRARNVCFGLSLILVLVLFQALPFQALLLRRVLLYLVENRPGRSALELSQAIYGDEVSELRRLVERMVERPEHND